MQQKNNPFANHVATKVSPPTSLLTLRAMLSNANHCIFVEVNASTTINLGSGLNNGPSLRSSQSANLFCPSTILGFFFFVQFYEILLL